MFNILLEVFHMKKYLFLTLISVFSLLPAADAGMISLDPYASSSESSSEADEGVCPHQTDQRGLCIVIPAYNEENRIGKTLADYHGYFVKQPYKTHILVVLNGCTDNTKEVVEQATGYGELITYLNYKEGGKGFAIKNGFLDALKSDAEYIGFVDADGATKPDEYARLYNCLVDADAEGIIASRYRSESNITPARPWIKEWGRRLCFNPIVGCLFGLRYADTQCGAKIFKKDLLKEITERMTEPGWAFDVELLWLARQEHAHIIEEPTTWQDQDGSHLDPCCSGCEMFGALCKLRCKH